MSDVQVRAHETVSELGGLRFSQEFERLQGRRAETLADFHESESAGGFLGFLLVCFGLLCFLIGAGSWFLIGSATVSYGVGSFLFVIGAALMGPGVMLLRGPENEPRSDRRPPR